MFCCNLRNKQYCFRNEQLTKEEYERVTAEWDFHSRQTYEQGKEDFRRMMEEKSWHRALFIDRSEASTGNYLDECKNCDNCYFMSGGMEDCANVLRAGGGSNDCLDCIGPAFKTELVYLTTNPQDQCYDVRFCYDVVQCKWMEYCAHCYQCEHCFGCCGLVGKKYYIFNKEYTPDEYENQKKKIIAAMQKSGEYGQFFPASFAGTCYEETASGFYWPLSLIEGKKMGFRMREAVPERSSEALDASLVHDRSDKASDEIPQKKFWDHEAQRPFQIQQTDIDFCISVGVPLPWTYYARRLQENFRLIPFNGTTRQTTCAQCKTATATSWPEKYEGRILCEDCYLKEVY